MSKQYFLLMQVNLEKLSNIGITAFYSRRNTMTDSSHTFPKLLTHQHITDKPANVMLKSHIVSQTPTLVF